MFFSPLPDLMGFASIIPLSESFDGGPSSFLLFPAAAASFDVYADNPLTGLDFINQGIDFLTPVSRSRHTGPVGRVKRKETQDQYSSVSC